MSQPLHPKEVSPGLISAKGTTEPLLHALAAAGPRDFAVLANQFVHRWSKALGTEAVFEPSDNPTVRFKTQFTGLYLRGFEEPHCVLIPPFIKPDDLSSLGILNGISAENSLLVLCPSAEHYPLVAAALPKGRTFILSPSGIAGILAGDVSRNRDVLRRTIREQVDDLRWLHTFDTTRPVAGEMFFGRRRELDLLRYQERDCFLITGPSKIGKSSLLYHYHWALLRNKDPRLSCSFYVDLQPCTGWHEDAVARFFATKFRDVPYTSRDLKFRELRSFLFTVQEKARSPIEIIIDEADAVCHMDLLLTVAEFATSSRSRLIVVGRGAVRRFWLKHQSTAFGRLRDLRFQVLSRDEAWHLFTRPIEALGLRLESPELIRELILRETSRMPHLIQHCARSVITLASEMSTDMITPTMLHRGRDSFFDFGILRTHLDDLHSDLARLAALNVLEGVRQGIHTPDKIQEILKGQGFTLSIGDVTYLCDDLVMNCLQTWDHSGYGPPRWDICETAQRHAAYLASIRQECLNRVNASVR